MKLRFAAFAAATTLAATSLVACSDDSSSSSSDGGTTLKIGTTDSTKLAWNAWVDAAAEKGINIDVVNYADYNSPNEALSQDQLDANLFQHLKFLAEYNVGKGTDLAPVGSTEIVPLALYWKDHDSLDGIEGEEVALPNDPANLGRALNVLHQAGLVEFKEEGLLTPTQADVDTDKSKVKITPVDAAQSTVAYGEGKPAIINNTFLERSGIDPNSSVFADDPESEAAEPYINVLVTTKDNVDNEDLKTLVELWHTDEVQKAVEEDSKGTSVAVDRSQEDLQKILDRIEEQTKN